MKRKRFTKEQIIGILNEAEQTGNIREVCQLNNISEQTFYCWRTKFGGMDVSEAERLKELERENRELKKMVVDISLDVRMLKELNSKNSEPCGSTAQSRTRLPCQVIEIWRSSKRRSSGRIEEARLVRHVHVLTERYPRFGHRKIHAILRAEEIAIGSEARRPASAQETTQTAADGQEHDRRGPSALPDPRMELLTSCRVGSNG